MCHLEWVFYGNQKCPFVPSFPKRIRNFSSTSASPSVALYPIPLGLRPKAPQCGGVGVRSTRCGSGLGHRKARLGEP